MKGNGRSVEVEYGNDLPSDKYASGFPTGESKAYADDKWNLNNLHRTEGNLLRNLSDRVIDSKHKSKCNLSERVFIMSCSYYDCDEVASIKGEWS